MLSRYYVDMRLDSQPRSNCVKRVSTNDLFIEGTTEETYTSDFSSFTPRMPSATSHFPSVT